MLLLIVQICSYIKHIIYFGLVISYKTGQLIINGLNIIVDFLLQVNKNIGTALLVLIEDFSIFLSDIGQRVSCLIGIISDILQKFTNCITIVIDSIKYMTFSIVFLITAVYNTVFAIITKVLAGIIETVVTIKHFILLLGSGIWFAITVIPLFIVYTCTMFTYYIGRVIDELTNIISNSVMHCKLMIINIYKFITDVPFESLAGLIAGVCIAYVIIKFHILLYHKFLSALELVRQNMYRVRSVFTRLTRYRQPIQQSSSESEQSDSSDESNRESDDTECSEHRMCLICHERLKCILMLPCRHVCLCNICNIRLQNYNRTCPICRSVVQKTMKVFV